MKLPVSGAGLVMLALAVSLLILPILGCREEPPSQFDRNKRPETFLTGVPAESSLTFYQVHLYWSGFDSDGYVSHYQWAITDSLPQTEFLPWVSTTRADSTFVLRVTESSQIAGRRFYVRAIDNEGARDETPAYTFFVARDAFYPDIVYLEALGTGTLVVPPYDFSDTLTSTNADVPTDTIPASGTVHFRWTGVDRDTVPGERIGDVVGFRYKLNTRQLDWVGGTLADTAATYAGLSSGVHVFYVQAVDDAGLATDSFVQSSARRSFVANFDPNTWFRPDEQGRFTFVADGTEPHVNGDTLDGGRVRSVTSWASANDRDGSVTGIQFRVGGNDWERAKAGSVDIEGSTGSVRDGDYDFVARSVDNLGRPDGTPARIRFYVGWKPLFISDVVREGIHFVQFPMDGDTVVVDSTGVFRIKFYATDRDPTGVDGYSFSLDGAPFGGVDPALTATNVAEGVPARGYLQAVVLPPETDTYRWEGEHLLAVRCLDLGGRLGYSKNPRFEDYVLPNGRPDQPRLTAAASIRFNIVKARAAAGGSGRVSP